MGLVVADLEYAWPLSATTTTSALACLVDTHRLGNSARLCRNNIRILHMDTVVAAWDSEAVLTGFCAGSLLSIVVPL